MQYAQTRTLLKDAVHVLILIILIVAAWFVLVWAGFIQCDLIPRGCDVYWGMLRFSEGGKPRVLIVHGTGGLGDYELLQNILSNPQYAGARPRTVPLEQVTLGNLRDYDLVIVEEARKMSTAKMKVFIDYAVQGGRLVWTGDAAAELAAGDSYLYEHERNKILTCEDVLQKEPHANIISDIDCESEANRQECERIREEQPNAYIAGTDCVWARQSKVLGPLARKDELGRMINFDQLIGVQYIGGFCELQQACTGSYPFIGRLVPEPERKHPLIKNIRQDLLMYGDFAIAEEAEGAYTTRVLSVEYAGFIDVPGKGAVHSFPVIVTAGPGQKVAYYALPPEQFAADALEQKYYSLVEQMYYGMLGMAG